MPTYVFATMSSPFQASALDAALKEAAAVKPYYPYTVKVKTATPYVLVLADGDPNTVIRMDMAVANQVTLPADVDVPLPLGTRFAIEQWGVGTTTIVPGVDATLIPDIATMTQQYQRIWVEKIGTNDWRYALEGGVTSSWATLTGADPSVNVALALYVAGMVDPGVVPAATGRALTQADNGASLRYDGAGAANFTVPNTLLGPFECEIVQWAAGVATVISDGTSLVRVASGKSASTAGQYSSVAIQLMAEAPAAVRVI